MDSRDAGTRRRLRPPTAGDLSLRSRANDFCAREAHEVQLPEGKTCEPSTAAAERR